MFDLRIVQLPSDHLECKESERFLVRKLWRFMVAVLRGGNSVWRFCEERKCDEVGSENIMCS